MKKTENLIKEVCSQVQDLIISKNRNYGDSATNPCNIFAKGNAIQSLCARIDDKLSRIKNKGINDETEDTVTDLIGYLILLKVAIKQNESNKKNSNVIFESDMTLDNNEIINIFEKCN